MSHRQLVYNSTLPWKLQVLFFNFKKFLLHLVKASYLCYLIVVFGVEEGEGTMGTNFRTNLFGGFRKTDVVSYIEKMAKETQEKVSALEQENALLRAKNQDLSSQLDCANAQFCHWNEENISSDILRGQLSDALGRAEEAERLAASLRGPAEEYRKVKDHIAEIEINAHRRTEEFRAQAVERLRAVAQQQRQWLEDQRCQYGAINDELMERLRQCQQNVEGADYSSLDRMEDILDDIEAQLEN